MHENTLTKEEEIGIKWIVYLSFFPEDLHNCSTGRNPCSDPWSDMGTPYKDGCRGRVVQETKKKRGCVGKCSKDHRYAIPFSDKEPGGPHAWDYCPRRFQFTHIPKWGMSFEWLKNYGTMPVDGPLEDQPAKWVQAMDVWKMVHMKCKTESERRALEKQKKAAAARRKRK